MEFFSLETLLHLGVVLLAYHVGKYMGRKANS